MKRSKTVDLEGLKAKVAKAQAQLEAGLARLQTSDDWKHTLQLMALLGPTRISRYSFRNIVLLGMQREGIRHAATFNSWLTRGRAVKKGEKGLTILRPRILKKGAAGEEPTKAHGVGESNETRLIGFSPMTVFALEQTDGEPLPTAVMPQDFKTPEGFAHSVERLREVALALPHVSGIELRARRLGDIPGAYGWFNRQTKWIVVITETSPAQQFATLVHELAHAILHGEEGHHDRATKEVEAESTAYVVCHALGLDTGSFSLPYVASWASGDDAAKEVARVGERVRATSAQLLAALVPATEEEEEATAA